VPNKLTTAKIFPPINSQVTGLGKLSEFRLEVTTRRLSGFQINGTVLGKIVDFIESTQDSGTL
jgi:hypothetical protein